MKDRKKYYLNVTMQIGERNGKTLVTIKTNYAGKYFKTEKEAAEKIEQIKKMI